MNLEQAEQFRQQKRAEGATSDGCTFAPELGTPCCEMHDYLRRFKPIDPDTGKPITALKSDNLMAVCIFKKGRGIKALLYWLAAPIYWLVVRISYLFGSFK